MADTKFITGPRDAYFNALYPIFQADKNCIIITADNGAPSLDQFAQNLPGQFYTVGIAEQQMVGMAAGMALEGKRVWIYAIAPFVTTRVHEFVKLDICAMNLPVTLLGVGAGFAYDIMGPSHHTVEDVAIMRVFPNLEIWSPADAACAAMLAEYTYKSEIPCYVRFDRAGLPDLYDKTQLDVRLGFFGHALTQGESARRFEQPGLFILSTGVMVHEALKVGSRLFARGIPNTVVDIFRIKPFPYMFFDSIVHFSNVHNLAIVTLEEQVLSGGLGSIVAETIVDGGMSIPLLRLGVGQDFCFTYGGREAIWEKYGLDAKTVVDKISQWIGEIS